jgi:ATP-binding cassette, subfamily B, bacterial
MGFSSDGRGLDVEGAPRPEERRKLTLKPLTRLAPYVVRYRGRALAALFVLVFSALPVAVRRMIDFGFSDRALQLIDSYFAVMIGVVAVLAISSAMRYYLVTTLGERIVADLRSDVFAHLTQLSSSFFDTARTGEIVSRLTADTTQIKSTVGASVSIALRNLLLFLGGAAMMVVTSPRLSLFVLGAIPIIVLPLVGFGRAVRRRGRAAQDTLAEASGYADELIGAVRTLQAFTNEKLAQSRFSAAVERAFAAARDATKARGVLTAVVIFLVFASIVVVLWVGAQDVLAGHITPGRLGQFVLYAVFAAGGLSELSQVWGEIAQASGAAERLFEILDVEPQIKAPPRPLALPAPARGAVEFKDVSFEYPGRPNASVLNHVSFHVAPGEKLALVGPSGAGKSTVFQLIQRFYDPVAGTVIFDGVSITDVDPAALRSSIALVPQDAVIFGTSVKENIRFGRPDATDGEIEKAAAAAHASDFIRRLPDGYETQVGERGVTLSGGQRQRLALARALLKDPPVLVLDDSLSAVDTGTEGLILNALRARRGRHTTLIIAHRLSSVVEADRIVVLDAGRAVQVGSHAELSTVDGPYRHLCQIQGSLDAEIRVDVSRAGS